jgi:hypothetical protein
VVVVVVVVATGYWLLSRSREGYKFGNVGVTEKTGTFAINPQFDVAWRFSEGLAMVRVGSSESGKYG